MEKRIFLKAFYKKIKYLRHYFRIAVRSTISQLRYIFCTHILYNAVGKMQRRKHFNWFAEKETSYAIATALVTT